MSDMRILISRPDRIGDVIVSTAIPREIKMQFPGAYVAMLLKPYTRDIYINNPYVDEIIIYDPDDTTYSFREKLSEIRKHRFTHALMLLPNEKINYLLFLAGIRRRIGVGHKFYQFITGASGVSRNKYIPLRHEADYCMDLARKIGVATDNLDPEIYLSNGETEKVRLIRKELAPDNEIVIGIHSTSGNSAPNMPPSEYKILANMLSAIKGVKLVITDNKVPPELTHISGAAYPNTGLDLRASILNFAALDLLISASTGPMHICAALKVLTLSLFCPLTACSPTLWGPKGNKAYILLPDGGYCEGSHPCKPSECTFAGKGGIDAGKVFSEITKIFPEISVL